MAHHVDSEVVTSDNVRLERHDLGTLRDLTHWDRLSRGLREAVLGRLPPDEVVTTSNVTCVALHEYYPLALTLSASDKKKLDPVDEIAFGDDDSSFSTADTSLNNEVGDRLEITDMNPEGKTLEIDEFLSSNEQNGNTLRELGVFSEDGQLYQHAPTSQVYQKDSSFALIINISITHGDI